MAGNAITVPLTQGRFALVDVDIYPLVSSVRWTACRAGDGLRWYAFRTAGYLKGKQKHEWLHHRILPKRRGWDVDHRDGDGLNCTRQNLRYAPRWGNNANQRKQKNRSSRFKGVTWDKGHACWRAQIQAFHRRYYLGLFQEETRAAHAYNQAAQKYFGSFARLNNI